MLDNENALNQGLPTNNFNSVAFIGLGAMGYPMASHLKKDFDTVLVWNRTFAKATQHAEQFNTTAVALNEATQADLIFSCLPTTDDVLTLIQTTPIKAGSIWVDCTSGDPAVAPLIKQALADKGVAFLDAPVSGQVIGAQNGTLTVMVGGEAATLNIAKQAIEPFAKHIFHVGNTGAGYAVKAVNNTLLAANLWAAAEGLSILKANGVTLPEAVACLNTSSGSSVALSNIIPDRVLNRSFPLTFNIDLLAKDTQIALDMAAKQKITAPLLAQTQNFVRAASNTTPNNTDFSQLVTLLENWTKVQIS